MESKMNLELPDVMEQFSEKALKKFREVWTRKWDKLIAVRVPYRKEMSMLTYGVTSKGWMVKYKDVSKRI